MAAGTHLYYLGTRLAAAQAIQIRAEERRLLRDFGSEYETYRASAPAIVPYGVVPRRSR